MRTCIPQLLSEREFMSQNQVFQVSVVIKSHPLINAYFNTTNNWVFRKRYRCPEFSWTRDVGYINIHSWLRGTTQGQVFQCTRHLISIRSLKQKTPRLWETWHTLSFINKFTEKNCTCGSKMFNLSAYMKKFNTNKSLNMNLTTDKSYNLYVIIDKKLRSMTNKHVLDAKHSMFNQE